MPSANNTKCPICSGALNRGMCPKCSYDEGEEFIKYHTLSSA